MQFKNWITNEVVKGIKRYERDHWQITVHLGRFGWFDTFSHQMVGESDFGGRIIELEDYYKLNTSRKSEWFVHTNNVSRVKHVCEQASDGLANLGFRKQDATMIFTNSDVPHGAEGAHTAEEHIIKIAKPLIEGNNPQRAIHVIAHEWSHAYWKTLHKDQKTNFQKVWIMAMGGQMGGLTSSYSMSGGPKEMFAELVGTGVSEPGKLDKKARQMIAAVASGYVPPVQLAVPDTTSPSDPRP